MSTHPKVIAQTDTHTDRHTDTMKTLPLPHTQEVKMPNELRFIKTYVYLYKMLIKIQN